MKAQQRVQNFPFNPVRFPFFYGWIVLSAGTLGILMSAPGQTVGVSVFTDSLIEALAIDRNLLSFGYLLGTLSSAALLMKIGRFYDRYRARIVATVAALALALTLLLLSVTPQIAGGLGRLLRFIPQVAIAFTVITVGFFLLRLSGQGVLTLASRNMVMEWFEARRGFVNAILGVSISFGFAMAPRVFESLVSANGWQGAWRWTAGAVAMFAVFAFLVFRDTPEAHGLLPDGGAKEIKGRRHAETAVGVSFTLKQARRTYSFWLFASALFLSALLMTAYTFHIISIFGDVGIPRGEAVTVFFPASVVAVSFQFSGSWLSDRIKLKYLVMVHTFGMTLLGVGIATLGPGALVWLAVAGHGVAQGVFGIVSNITWPRFFGREHLGAISGLATALTVAGSAIGPYFFSLLRDVTGSYAAPGIVTQ